MTEPEEEDGQQQEETAEEEEDTAAEDCPSSLAESRSHVPSFVRISGMSDIPDVEVLIQVFKATSPLLSAG